jgi:6-phosphogluconolactonase
MEYSALLGRVARAGCLGGVAIAAVACSESQSTTAPPAAASAGVASAAAGLRDRDLGSGTVGAVYTSTNATTGNAVVAFARSADGGLRAIGSFTTGGVGAGGGVDPLASQFSMRLSEGHTYLYVVNAGSDDITVFAVHGDGTLEWRQRTSSHGVFPVSLALYGTRLYALNAGDSSVATFAVHEDGTISSLAGGRRSLPSAVGGPSTIGVTPDGRVLLVTERTANRIDLFPLDGDGRPGEGEPIASHGATPFGFDVGHDAVVVVSEAGPNAVSSYEVRDGDVLDLRAGSVPTDQEATCWVRLTRDGRFAFSVNSGSASLSGFDVDAAGRLTPVSAAVPTGSLPAGSAPLDLDVTDDNRFVFTLEAGSGGIGGFAIGHDGTLTALPGAARAVAPASGAEGLAAF